jgi:hypothetical protein
MIDVSMLIANLDEVFGDNMFLKDARKADNLKSSVHTIFTDLNTRIDEIETQLSYTTSQTFSDMEELTKVKNAIKQYLRDQIELDRQLLNNLGDWY